MATSDFKELGSTGLRRSGGTVYEEFLTSLRGIRGARVYREMADNDPTIGSMLFAIEKVITRLEWRIEPYSDDSQDGETQQTDKEVAKFVNSCLNNMSDSRDSTLSQILSILLFGYSYPELVLKKRVGVSMDTTMCTKINVEKIGCSMMQNVS